jgi:hypothetical protein
MVLMSTPAALPRVQGRHRNKALATARRARAVELRTQGWTYQAIANELGYRNRGAVFQTVSKALQTHTVAAVDNLRDLEAVRLDALQASLWGRAMSGEVAAAQAVLRIIVRQMSAARTGRVLTHRGARPAVDRHCPAGPLTFRVLRFVASGRGPSRRTPRRTPPYPRQGGGT